MKDYIKREERVDWYNSPYDEHQNYDAIMARNGQVAAVIVLALLIVMLVFSGLGW